MGDLSPIPPASFKSKKRREIKRGLPLFRFCHIYLYYIIKKVPKTRANAVFPDAREQFKAYISRSFFGDDETGE